jgi:probable rRNA maturation factor
VNDVAVSIEPLGNEISAAVPEWAVEDFAQKVLAYLGRDNWDLSVLFCGNAYIRDLNSRFRGKDEATDVLSFPLGETVSMEGRGERYLPGDIAISLETLRENAVSFNTSEDEELRRLLIHGILHLDGMDHGGHIDSAGRIVDADAGSGGGTEPMLELQEKILAEIGTSLMNREKE